MNVALINLDSLREGDSHDFVRTVFAKLMYLLNYVCCVINWCPFTGCMPGHISVLGAHWPTINCSITYIQWNSKMMAVQVH